MMHSGLIYYHQVKDNMNYMYYSLYKFYTKIIRVQKYYPPIVNIAGIIGLLQSILIFVPINILWYCTSNSKGLPYSYVLPFGTAMVLYYFNERYFEKRESQILKSISNKPNSIKLLSHVVTLFVTILLVWGHFFNGFYEVIWDSF